MSYRINARLTNGAYWLVWFVLLLLPVIILWPHLNDYAWNYDEGVLLQTAALSSQGFPLFEETVFNKPPLIIWWLQMAFKLGGTAVSTARFSMIILNLGGLVALGWLAKVWWQQRWASPLAMALWLLVPDVLIRLPVVMNDLPGISFLLLTLVATTRFRQTGSGYGAAVSGLLFGVTIGLHPLLVFTGLPVTFLLLWGKPIDKHSGKVIGLFGFSLLLITAVWLLPSYGEGFVRWVFEYNRAELGLDLQTWAANNVGTLTHYLLHEQWLLLLLALLVVPRIYKSKRKIFVQTAVFWLVLTIFTLVQLRPMWPHYMIFAIYPLILLVAGGLTGIGQQLWHDLRQGGKKPLSQAALLGASIAVFALLIQQYATQSLEWAEWEAPAVRQYLTSQIAAQQMVISDDPFLIFASGHFVPPSLTDSSSKRISTGFLSVNDILNSTFAYNVDYFVFTNGRFNQLPQLQEWVETQAVEQISFDETTLYRLKQPPDLQIATQNQLEPGISLNGYTIKQTDASIKFLLYWETAVPLSDNYHRFIHLLDENGEIVVQMDGIPLNGWLPTNKWQPNVQLIDSSMLTLPPDIAAGSYTLVTGMYTFPEIQRLPATNDVNGRWPNDAILLQKIVIP
ncbi:hypothetical protein MNBD_CHLOROFLEXI01-541 [hydrothermal vent metagenome]|uniref:Glycosyltransferase RgtA/B/C/D-like domain-containing protein n=1 Tax=hydrothermal vent metagenome TaxID=652676 RepID=A0A3B0WIS6_9ZZZZ